MPLVASASLLFSACAHMEPPPGGPEDTRRPYVVAVSPAPDTLGVGRDLDARIKFSEWVSKDVERGKVYLSPPLAKSVRTELRGDELRVTSAGRLDTNTTYVLGLTGSIQDLHGLPLEAPLELAFSTGSSLDSGKVAGTVLPLQAAPVPRAFAALYPRGTEVRARFQHLSRRHDSTIVPGAQPDPFREKPAYLAPADSLGRFAFRHVRPGRYGLLGFQDVNGNLAPDANAEALAIGPTVEAAAVAGPAQTLSLAPYDTARLRLAEAVWVHESLHAGRSRGTVRLRFNHAPQPYQALRREIYSVAVAGPDSQPLAPVPVLDVCRNPFTGDIELSLPPLAPDSLYRAACAGLRDLSGNPIDTAHAGAFFRADTTAKDTAALRMTFLGPRRATGEPARLQADPIFPAAGLTAYYPRLLTDSLQGWLRGHLAARLDTAPQPFVLERRNHHEFFLKFPTIPLQGQRLVLSLAADSAGAIGPGGGAAANGPRDGIQAAGPAAKTDTAAARPTAASPDSAAHGASARPDSSRAATRTAKADTAAKPAPAAPVASFTVADASKLGSLRFGQDRSAYGSRLLIRALASPFESAHATPPADSFTIDSLPPGYYAVDYFRDANGDGLWNPGSVDPWSVAEPYVHWADSVEVKPGEVVRGDGLRPGARRPAGADSSTTERAAAPARKLAWPPEW